MALYIYIYIYIERERERERESFVTTGTNAIVSVCQLTKSSWKIGLISVNLYLSD